MTRLTILDPGPLALVQDAGRAGLAHLGVSASGAMDRAAHALANRLVGNDPSAATVEVLVGGFRAVFDAPTWFAVTGAWGPLALDGSEVPHHTAVLAEPGTTLELAAATAGIRYYLALRGGVEVAPVLGSRSRDTLAALGPAPLATGDSVQLGPEPAAPVPAVDLVPVAMPEAAVTLELRPGPRREWFDDASWRALLGEGWTASARSDRTGVRLEGPPLVRQRGGELPSEGMVAGAMQVSPDGQPTILAADHPVTGGYPVIAVVTDASLDALAQLRPGQPVRFTLATGHY